MPAPSLQLTAKHTTPEYFESIATSQNLVVVLHIYKNSCCVVHKAKVDTGSTMFHHQKQCTNNSTDKNWNCRKKATMHDISKCKHSVSSNSTHMRKFSVHHTLRCRGSKIPKGHNVIYQLYQRLDTHKHHTEKIRKLSQRHNILMSLCKQWSEQYWNTHILLSLNASRQNPMHAGGNVQKFYASGPSLLHQTPSFS